MYRMFLKRLFDFTAALIGSLLAFQIELFAGIIIYMQDRQSLFFTKIQPGKNEHLFRFVKLRTVNKKKMALAYFSQTINI
jgi:undecaprenyl phosphate N,N'-diacetylbacillosamine 1-phosphate transferase